MSIIELTFFGFVIFLIFTVLTVYVIYPLLIHFLPERKQNELSHFSSKTRIYHILPLYNEELVVKKKLENCLKIKYPHPSQTIVVIDQSNDNTSVIAQSFMDKYPDKIRVISKEYRKGKNDSINVAVESIQPGHEDILFFSDSNTFFETNSFIFIYEKLLQGFVLVGGSMKYLDEESDTAKSEGLYWKYEEWIRKNEAKLGKCIVVNGGNFAMSAKYILKLPSYVPNDFEAPLRLCGSGLPVGFEEKSIGYEKSIQNIKEELQRKKRMANRQMNCVSYLWLNLNLETKIQVLIRKALRWSGFHIFMLSYMLILLGKALFDTSVFDFLFYSTTLPLVLIMVAIMANVIGVKNKIAAVSLHVIWVHYYSFKGMVSSILGSRVSIWEKAESNRKNNQ